MSRVVALRLDSQSALAAVVRTSGGGVAIDGVVEIPLAGADARDAGQKIAAALSPLAVGRAPVVAAVPRGELHWQNYDLPPAPASEIAELVHMQVQRDLTLADDGLGFDYLSLQGDETHPHRVLGVGVAPPQLERIRGICAAAELRLQRIVPEPLGWVELGRLVAKDSDPAHVSLGVFAALVGRQAVVWAAEVDAIRLLRIVWLAPEQEAAADVAALATELRRTLLSLSQRGDAPSASLPCVYVGDAAATVAAQLSSALGRPIRGAALDGLIDNLPSDPARAAEAAPLAGLAAAVAANRQAALDLLHPHRPPAPPSRRRTYGLAAVAALLLAALAAWTGYGRLQSPLAAAAAADAERAGMTPLLERLAKDEAQAAAVDGWLGESVNLLTELDYLSERLRPKTLDSGEFNHGEDIVLTKLSLSGKQLTLTAALQSAAALAPIEQRLREGLYRVIRGAVESHSEAVPGYGSGVTAVIERVEAGEVAEPAA